MEVVLPGLFVAIVLIASLLFVHFSMRARPMPITTPLNVDTGLPLPEVGQASTVFSLTALFGAYLGIYLFLGVPAFAGLACGTVVGLFVVRGWILRHGAQTFEDFLSSLLTGNSGNAGVFALTVSAAQCAYAASELLILRELARVSLGIRSDYATVVAIAVVIIGYFYVLFGGYAAVFRTDVVQFSLIAVMGVFYGMHSIGGNLPVHWSSGIWPRPGYWELPLIGTAVGKVKYLYHFLLGTIMGLGLLAAAPDAWKRVFIVTRFRKRTLLRFLVFIVVGIAPFVILLPVAASASHIPDGVIDIGKMFTGLITHNLLFTSLALGLIASFLSAFDSAVLASVHMGLMNWRRQRPAEIESIRFHWLMATALLVVFLLFSGLVSSHNPYLLGNVLLGPYAIIAAVQVGTRAMPSRLPKNSLLGIILSAFAIWCIWFGAIVKHPEVPTTDEVNTVPGGVCIFLVVTILCYMLSNWRRNAV
jgi:hypothetical protein